MKIIELQDRPPILVQQLLGIWEKSVKATHLFLSDWEIQRIQHDVPQALTAVAHLIMAETEDGLPIAFMGIEGDTLEMLFLTPEEMGKGIGKCLMQYGIEHYKIQELTVNEQNPQAKGFYEHIGFQAYKRSEYDQQVLPYPLVFMRRP